MNFKCICSERVNKTNCMVINLNLVKDQEIEFSSVDFEVRIL